MEVKLAHPEERILCQMERASRDNLTGQRGKGNTEKESNLLSLNFDKIYFFQFRPKIVMKLI
jgi:hypothetical protein